MPEEATLNYEEKVQQLAQLKLKAAQAEQEVKNELKKRKAAGIDPSNKSIVNTYTAWAAAAGLLMGLPVVSGAAITAIQIRMLDQLAERFGQNYTANEARNTLYAITGGLITPLFAGAPVTAVASAIPIVGPLAGLLAGPALAAASTRMVGRLFLEHFEHGGKVSDLDVAKAKKDYEAGLKTEAEKHAAGGNAATT
jgi:uncharacterized protein (DUF697 family)